MDEIKIIFAVIFGLCFGSFANVLIYRMPRKISIILPPSQCPACSHRLRVLDLLPVASWLALGGSCRYCKASIGWRYPIVELVCALLFVAMVGFTASFSAIPLAFFAFILVSISLIDWDTQEIPDGLLVAGGICGILWVVMAYFAPYAFPLAPYWLDGVLGVVAGALPLLLIDRLAIFVLKKDGFGYGDVKLMAVAGLFLGWQLVFVAYYFAFIIGGVYAIFLLVTRRARRGGYMAFGPFLALGILGALWFGQKFISAMFFVA